QSLGRLVGRAGRVVAAGIDDERAVLGDRAVVVDGGRGVVDLGHGHVDRGRVRLGVQDAVGRAVVGDRVAEAVGAVVVGGRGVQDLARVRAAGDDRGRPWSRRADGGDGQGL